MKPFYNLGYTESLLSFFRLNGRQKNFLRWSAVSSLLIFTTFLFILYNFQVIFLLALFAIGVVSMLHMRFAQWLGAIDLNLMITVYVSMQFGFPAGFFVSHAEIVGLILAGDIDNNLIYDLLASYFVALVASFFTVAYFVPVVTVLVVIYCIAGIIYHFISGTLHFANTTWYVTNIMWVFFVVYKLIPLFLGMF